MKQPFVTLSVSSMDGHRTLSGIALVGFAAATGLAVMGLPTIDLHGPLHQWGIMDPFCGGTRAARYTMQGQWTLAWAYNPLGIAAVAAAIVGLVRVLGGLILGRWVNVRLRWTPRRRRLVAVTLAVVLVILEVRQQSLAEMLRRSVDSSPQFFGTQ